MSNSQVIRATKWSVICEVVAKVIAPITTIILARLLSQEVFGIVASITAITSLADMLSDAGFNAYIIQHQFSSDKEKKSVFNICFWTNLLIAAILFVIILINRHMFSRLVGAEGYSNVLVVAAFVIPIMSISSIEMAIMKKDLNFKSLGIIKIVSKFIPFLTTIPLAFCGFGYWSLVIGSLIGEFIGMMLCFKFAGFSPTRGYDISRLKSIFSFSGWAYLESILEWLLSNIAFLTLASIYGIAALGLFKVGMNMISQIINSIYALYSNVYKSAISKEQYNYEKFKKLFLTFQNYSSIISLPLGVGTFIYRDFITTLLLGKDWGEASIIVGGWALAATLSIAFGNFYSDAIRAKGYPKRLVQINLVYLVLIICLLSFSSKITFSIFCIAFCSIKVIQPLLQVIYGSRLCKISFGEILKTSYPQLIATSFMTAFGILFNLASFSFAMNFIGIGICIIVYVVTYYFMVPDKAIFKILRKA